MGGRVTVARRGRTVAQLAERWRMSPDKAREFLVAFERRGYARKSGRWWYATEKATRIIGFRPDDDAVPDDEAA